MRTINGYRDLDRTQGTRDGELVRFVYQHQAWGEDVPATHQRFMRWDVAVAADGRKVGCWVAA